METIGRWFYLLIKWLDSEIESIDWSLVAAIILFMLILGLVGWVLGGVLARALDAVHAAVRSVYVVLHRLRTRSSTKNHE